MAEDAWQNIPYKAKPNMESVFDKGWIKENERFATYDNVKWDRIRQLRNDVNRCIGESSRRRDSSDLSLSLSPSLSLSVTLSLSLTLSPSPLLSLSLSLSL